VLAQLGRDAAAAQDLAEYLTHEPQAEDAAPLRERLRGLGGDPAGKLH
jgi:regulator of sirC expression with transglutaminase-like and TPR domain